MMTATMNAETRFVPDISMLIDDEEMFERRKKVIQTSWQAVRFGLDVRSTQALFNRLFEQYPTVRPFFKDDMTVQYNKLYKAVTFAVRCLDDLERLIPVLMDLGIRHAGFGVAREHYVAMAECFVWTLNSYIIAQMPNNSALNWIFEVTDAWEWAFEFIGGIMADAAEEEVDRLRRRAIREGKNASTTAEVKPSE